MHSGDTASSTPALWKLSRAGLAETLDQPPKHAACGRRERRGAVGASTGTRAGARGPGDAPAPHRPLVPIHETIRSHGGQVRQGTRRAGAGDGPGAMGTLRHERGLPRAAGTSTATFQSHVPPDPLGQWDNVRERQCRPGASSGLGGARAGARRLHLCHLHLLATAVPAPPGWTRAGKSERDGVGEGGSRG